MRIPIRLRLFLVVLLGVLIPTGVTLYMALERHSEQLNTTFLHEGRAMYSQIVVVRRWLSTHGGVYVIKRPFVKESPFMDNANTATLRGDPIILRSPDLITREISELSAEDESAKFRIVAKNPVNPANKPTFWERAALEEFERGLSEAWTISGDGSLSTFRYMGPIRTEKSCFRCHQESGYRVGQVRGGITIEFPVGDTLMEAAQTRRNLIIGYALMAGAIMVLLWIGASSALVKPMAQIHGAVEAMAKGDFERPLAIERDDEIGDLAGAVIEMRSIISGYNRDLENEVKARTEEIETIRDQVSEERDFFIGLFDRMADGVCVVSRDTREVEYMNESLELALGGKRDSADRSRIIGGILSSRGSVSPGRRGEVTRTEIKDVSGERTFEVMVTELKFHSAGSWIMVFRDVTDRKRLEADLLEINRDLEAKVKEQTEILLEQERLATLGEVSAGLAHEIRNPLSAIMSGVSLLESSRRTPEERERILNLIKKEARRLNTSLTDFLLFARPQDPKKVRIDLGAIIHDIVRLVEDDPDVRGEVEINTEIEKMPIVWFDDDKLRQVLWNMAINALQSMGGSGTLTIRAAMAGEDLFVIEIIDTGPGIPDEIRDRVFDPFFSTKKQGTGLGLPIVKRIVASHGGSVDFECPARGGCVFRITAPVGGPA